MVTLAKKVRLDKSRVKAGDRQRGDAAITARLARKG